MKSIQISVTLAYVGTVETFIEERKKYQDMGYDSFLAPIPLWTDNLRRALSIMEEFAEKTGM
jgi:hypothetical protein